MPVHGWGRPPQVNVAAAGGSTSKRPANATDVDGSKTRRESVTGTGHWLGKCEWPSANGQVRTCGKQRVPVAAVTEDYVLRSERHWNRQRTSWEVLIAGLKASVCRDGCLSLQRRQAAGDQKRDWCG